MLLALLAITVRLLLPVEFFFTKTIPVPVPHPSFMKFWHTEVGNIGRFPITRVRVLLIASALVSFTLLVWMIASYRCMRMLILKTSAPFITQAMPHDGASESRKKRIPVVVSAQIQSPIVFGYLHPVIALPVLNLTEQEWDAIIEHEMNHYFHGDLWIKLAVKVTQIICWWNPFGYFTGRLVSELLEIRNDKKLISAMTEEQKLAYFECLLKVARHQKEKNAEGLALAFGSQTRSITARRFRLIDDAPAVNAQAKKRSLFLPLAAISLLIVIFLSFYIVFEPITVNPRRVVATPLLLPENAFMIQADGNTADLFYQGEFWDNVEKNWDETDHSWGSLAYLTLYKTIDEAL